MKNSGVLENIRLAFRGILTHKMRSFLTMLGIIIGIASIMAIVSTIRGTNEQIKQNLIGSGSNTVNVTLYQGDWPFEAQYNPIPDGLIPIEEETLTQISELDEVESVSKYLIRTYCDSIFYGNTQLTGGTLRGIDTAYFETVGLQITSGRGFVDRDYANFSKVVILDATAAKVLFLNESPIGCTVEIMGEPFTVIGTVRERNEFQPVINTIEDYYMYANSSSGCVFIPISDWPILFQFDEPESVVVRARNTDSMTGAGKKTEDLLNTVLTESGYEGEVIYRADDLLEQAKQLQDLSASTNSMLIWIAGISLLVGGIGVMNIMLVSVTERTREIGLKKALGAKRRRILGQFLTEAAVLTSIGGLIGVAVGIGLAYLIHFIAQVPVSISPSATLISLVFSTAVGVIFGLIPSVKASKLDPIEALRYE